MLESKIIIIIIILEPIIQPIHWWHSLALDNIHSDILILKEGGICMRIS